ncbi:MAG: ribosomal subunit interface protein [Phenylobacterium sp.]|jgi:ribosomal subunit interface protein|uniref:ribosome hibernation-promoting factor, HPF/YfiA family n=1 Tax=Phenylobacterium sp. TaxID=1871053 RepID=UPI00261EF50A|nr:ribosome-associated translation inhibitor RaiA [Phenylobacterium sp.]MDB5426735.1 ribosomal subunit interface protein [Phenylobacterium sp.]MDB5434291.1 ribosomal subunit interface protein [Phenylobacterium sp.]MDB5497098.1 ribosomal subunit interface protein [Phenylobacterium sp.]
MQVQVTGKHVDVGEALRMRVSDELSSSIGKYFDRGGGVAEVVISRDGHSFRVDCDVTLASGQQLITHGLGGDAHVAFDAASAKMEKRIRRYKNRLKDHHPQAMARQAETAAYYVLQAPADEEGEDIFDGDAASFPEPMVIAETETPITVMTVSMAVMELDLTESQTIVFRNAAHGGLSVVYRRPDGNIGWIDPERTKANGTGSHGTAEA